MFGRRFVSQEPAMLSTTDDLRIKELRELSTPDDVMREIPRTTG